ncbi:hypothetical protein SGRA_2667 [Saprospira grandis str. Lewin]|uniref:Uncharacterized protein n=1 Tax=Saprospira grandis (strain Lewin) TaxID=984262 RepID=H6L867_SAPGL|nr:hypothetical protein SGRA_2667 [Saprospira grandis str. Lewin]
MDQPLFGVGLFFGRLDPTAFLGLPRPLAGSGCVAARRSARPCAAKGG